VPAIDGGPDHDPFQSPELSDERIDELLAGARTPEEIAGPDGLLQRLTKRLLELERVRATALPARRSRRRSYHAVQSATGRNPRQRFSRIWAVLARVAFATSCHPLRPLGSTNAPSTTAEWPARQGRCDHRLTIQVSVVPEDGVGGSGGRLPTSAHANGSCFSGDAQDDLSRHPSLA